MPFMNVQKCFIKIHVVVNKRLIVFMMRKDEEQTPKHFRLSWAETTRSHHMNIFKLPLKILINFTTLSRILVKLINYELSS